MSEIKAKVLYDFESQEAADLQISTGEFIAIIDQEVGSGWWKARNTNGCEGFIPANYVEIISMPEPTCPPPPLPNEYIDMRSARNQVHVDDDSDWDDSENEDTHTNVKSVINRTSNRDSVSTSIYSETSKLGNIRMPKSFLRTGGEEFLLGQTKSNEKVEAKIEIMNDNGLEIYQWKRSPPQSCSIISHEKSSKFKGIKVFIVYNLESSYVDKTITRRYKQFDWFHKILSEKYPCIVIPPLPSKQAIGRYEDTFLECRQRRLQKWLTYITKHPILSNTPVVKHFLTVTDKSKWTTGKRTAENDQFRGAKFFYTVDSPMDDIIWDDYTKRIDKIINFMEQFEKSSKGLQESFIIFNKRQIGPICKEFSKIGSAINSVAKSISYSPDNNKKDISLLQGLQRSGDAFDKVGKIFCEQGKIDIDFLDDNLEEINGCTKEIPSLIDLAKCAASTLQNIYKKSSETKVNFETTEIVDKNVRVITRSVDAELHWMQEEREAQLRLTMKQYLTNQVDMYTRITNILAEALSIL